MKLKRKFKQISIPLTNRDRNAIRQVVQDSDSFLRNESAFVNFVFAKFFEGRIGDIFEWLAVPGSDMKYKGSLDNEPLQVEVSPQTLTKIKRLSVKKRRSASAQAAYLVQLVLEGKEQELQNEWSGGTK